MKRLYGVTTAMVTPFSEDGRPLLGAIEQMVEFLVRRGVHCLYPCGTTGEMFLMGEEERKQIAQTVVRQNKGRLTVFIHVGAMDVEETIRLAKHACDIGADGIGVLTPAFFSTHPDAMAGYYKKVFSSVPKDFPCYMYNIPQCAANDLTCDVVRRVTDACPNAVGIKYSLPDLIRTYEYMAVKDGFEVVQGADRLFLPALAMGCSGTVSGVSSVYPELFVKVFEAFEAGDIPAAREWQKRANQFVAALGAGSNMAIFKSGLAFRGMEAGHMHAPQMDYTAEQTERLWATLRELEASLPEETLVK